MKYFLVIGIEYKFFHKPADITIHIANQFVDTFQLDKDFLPATDIVKQIDMKWYEKHGKSHRLTRADWIERWKCIPSLFKVYEIDDSDIEGKLEIKVENSNSDYTNGFMKNSSVIRFSVVSIFKKELTENRGEKFMEQLVQLNEAITKKQNENVPVILNNRWPTAESFRIVRENEIYEKSGEKDHTWHIGGSFTAEFTINKMQDTKYVGLMEKNAWIENLRSLHTTELVLASCNQLLNIYDEDQRSNITKD